MIHDNADGTTDRIRQGKFVDKSLPFTLTPDAEIIGTGLMGYLPDGTTYAQLVEVFGKPLSSGDGHKVDAQWVVTFADGTLATIYNYKTGRNYNGPTAPPVEAITDWHVGGRKHWALELVLAALEA